MVRPVLAVCTNFILPNVLLNPEQGVHTYARATVIVMNGSLSPSMIHSGIERALLAC